MSPEDASTSSNTTRNGTSFRMTTLCWRAGNSTTRDTAVLTASLRVKISKGSDWAESATSAAVPIGSAMRTSQPRSRSSARL